MAVVTRAGLRDAVHRETGLPLREAAEIVDALIKAVAERLVAGETAADGCPAAGLELGVAAAQEVYQVPLISSANLTGGAG